MAETTGNTSLFPVFVLTILSIVLIPWTVYKFCCSASADAAKIWEAADKRRSVLRKLRSSVTVGNVLLVLLWLLWAFLLVHISQTQKDMTPFDPFEILGVSPGATPSEIKRAYFKKSLRYHPDKSDDPKDHKYFAEFISKAYQALTDPVAKENYEKFGHPDGQQSLDLGIALPEWLFTKDPRTLLILVLVFILLPLTIMACYLFRSNQYTGSNSIMLETLSRYRFIKQNIKESQGIRRIPDTLVVAKEFQLIRTPNEHQPALEKLRRLTLDFHPEVKEKPQFWKRHASILKAHMLLYAHLERAHSEVPSILKANLNFVLEKSIPLLQEMFKIACLPRSPYGFGWMTPALATIQCMQCVTQAVSLSVRQTQLTKRDASEGHAALLQLSGMNGQIARVLGKKGIRSLNHLQEMEEAERTKLLHSLKFDEATLHDIDTALQAVPSIEMSARIFVEEEEEGIQEGDLVTCRVRLVLTRRSHATGDVSDADLAGTGILCFSPYYPALRPEKWYIMVTMPNENRVICSKHVVLKEAELAGLRRSSQNPQEEEIGQIVDLQFPALIEGTFSVQVGCYSDCWIGSDKTTMLKLTVKKASKMRQATKPAYRERSSGDDDEDDAQASDEEETPEGDHNKRSDGEGSDEEDEEDGDDYDSEETGELETGTDEEEQSAVTNTVDTM